MIGVLFMAAASCITRTGAFNTCPFGIPRGWQKRASSRLSEASVTVTTTPSLRRSMASTRPRSSIDVDRGATSRRSSLLPWNGSIGSTTDEFWSLSGIYRQPKPRNGTMPCWKNQHWPHNLNQMASGKPGAVHHSPSRMRRPVATARDVRGYGSTIYRPDVFVLPHES